MQMTIDTTSTNINKSHVIKKGKAYENMTRKNGINKDVLYQ